MEKRGSQGILARKLLVQLPYVENVEELWRNILTIANDRQLDNVILFDDLKLIFMSIEGKPMRLNSGMKTLQGLLKLSEMPTRITHMNPIPDAYIKLVFSDGFDCGQILYRFGPKFEDAALQKVLSEHALVMSARVRNAEIREKDITTLYDEGKISAKEYGIIKSNKRNMEQDRTEKLRNPDLDGEHKLSFVRYMKKEGSPGRVPDPDSKPVHVTIRGYPRDQTEKQKHYYIYSHKPNYGKSYAFMRFAERYNAAFIPDCNNWVGVPRTAQFLILDEVGSKNKLEFQQLKKFANASATCASGNNKTHGESYIPRLDVQIVCLSNRCIFDIYGEWNPYLQKRMCSEDVRMQLTERFHLIRLDGDVNEDIRQYSEPSTWTLDEFKLYVAESHYSSVPCVNLNPVARVRYDVRYMGQFGYAWHAFNIGRAGNFDQDLLCDYLDELSQKGVLKPACKYIMPSQIIRELFCADTNKNYRGKRYSEGLERLKRLEADGEILPSHHLDGGEARGKKRKSTESTEWTISLFTAMIESMHAIEFVEEMKKLTLGEIGLLVKAYERVGVVISTDASRAELLEQCFRVHGIEAPVERGMYERCLFPHIYAVCMDRGVI